MAATVSGLPGAHRAIERQPAEAGLSIVVPVYNEGAGLPRLHGSLTDVIERLRLRWGLGCEIIYVDDGSRDNSLAVAKSLRANNCDIQVISLSRNFGKEAALLAGLEHARLGAVLFIDGDGQHPPDLIEILVGHWLDDAYDVIFTAKAHRENESATRRFAVKSFYALINWGARQKIPPDAGDFRLLSPRALAAGRPRGAALLRRSGLHRGGRALHARAPRQARVRARGAHHVLPRHAGEVCRAG